jgi:hypothetical protein
MPTLNSHTITHDLFISSGVREPQAVCQAAQSSRTSQSLSKSVSEPTHGRKKKKYDRTTLCISNSGFSAILKRKTINQRSVLSDSLVG